MFGSQLMLGAILISISVVFHVVTLIFLFDTLKKVLPHVEHLHRIARVTMLMVGSVVVIILIHTVEAWTWAAVYLYLGEFDNLQQSLYFSVVTATTLGYGDIVLSERWQLLATFEAMGGLILFGVSTAFLLELMRHLFRSSDSGGGRE